MYSRLAFATFQHRPVRAGLGATLIVVSLTAILLAAGFADAPAAAADSGSMIKNLALLRPLFRRFAPAFLIACAAITFVSTWARVDTRTYDMAVLRFLGASKMFVIAIIATEALLVSLGGAILAVLISQGLLSRINAVTAAAPPYAIGLEWCLIAPSIIVGAALGGSAIPCVLAFDADVRETLERDR